MSPTTYELPDGKIVDIADEKFSISERFFNPVILTNVIID